MASIFALTLVIATIITGLLWCLNKFVFVSKDRTCHITSRTVLCDSINNHSPPKINLKISLIKTGASLFPVLATVLIVRSFIYEPFQIPSGSMMPTLLVSDFILVKKFAYSIKDPVYQKTLIKTGYPKRGDIVVFKYPNNPSLNYVKRVVGLPGDRISYDPISKKIAIQPNYRSSTYCRDRVFIRYSNDKLSNFVQPYYFFSSTNKMTDNYFKILKKNRFQGNNIRLIESEEILDDNKHHILTLPIAEDQSRMYYHQPGQKSATWIVPPKQYFMMGDNRDNSSDSRYWGFVPEENLIGKVTAIWMSFEQQENKWPFRLRLNRIGRIY